jgi:hypothetical protein
VVSEEGNVLPAGQSMSSLAEGRALSFEQLSISTGIPIGASGILHSNPAGINALPSSGSAVIQGSAIPLTLNGGASLNVTSGLAGALPLNPPKEIINIALVTASSTKESSASAEKPSDRTPPVRSLQLRNVRLPYGSLEILKVVLPTCADIVDLRFVGCELSSADLVLLGDVLAVSLHLRYLSLDHQANLGSNFNWCTLIPPELQSLSLRGNGITDADVLALVTALKPHRALISINLSRNNIGRVGAEHLADLLLRGCPQLAALSLGSNLLTDEATLTLAKALSRQALPTEEALLRRKYFHSLERDRLAEEENVRDVDIMPRLPMSQLSLLCIPNYSS